VGDWQLARFKADPANAGQVMDRGLWRHTRHPNYFGDFCVWWGLYLLALSAGAWWSIVGPLIMSFLLLRFSGVRLLERDIGERRPAYAEYVRRTNAFFPGPRKA
jgi:steroid 5-alpha reductase family enzyme